MEGMSGPHQTHPVRNQNQQSPEPTPVAPSAPTRKWYEPTLESKIVVSILMIASVLVILAYGSTFFAKSSGVGDLVKDDQYQAVFLNDGQVYFGSITGANDDTMVLEDIFYLRVDQQIQPEEDAAPEDPQVSLAKLGNEPHGPEDQMFINRTEVMFWENLREDGQVTQAIREFQESGGDVNMNEEALDELDESQEEAE